MTEMRRPSDPWLVLVIITVHFTLELTDVPQQYTAYVMSYFPLTSPLTVLIRQSVTVFPAMQIALHVLCWFLAVFAIWVSEKLSAGISSKAEKFP